MWLVRCPLRSEIGSWIYCFRCCHGFFPLEIFFSSSKDIFAVFDSLNGVPFWVFRESFAFEIIQLILTLHREQLYFGWGVKLLDCFCQNLTLFCQRSLADYESGFPLKILRNFNICDFQGMQTFCAVVSQSQKIINSKDWYLTYKWKSSLKIFRWKPKEEELFNFTVYSVIYILCKTMFVII